MLIHGLRNTDKLTLRVTSCIFFHFRNMMKFWLKGFNFFRRLGIGLTSLLFQFGKFPFALNTRLVGVVLITSSLNIIRTVIILIKWYIEEKMLRSCWYGLNSLKLLVECTCYWLYQYLPSFFHVPHSSVLADQYFPSMILLLTYFFQEQFLLIHVKFWTSRISTDKKQRLMDDC